MFRERERTGTNLFIGLLDLLRLKRGSTVQHSVQNDTDGPVVNLIAVATVGLKDLRSQVVGGSADCALLLALVENLGSKTEISHLQLHLVREEQVAKLQVSVDHLTLVDVLHGYDELVDVVAGFNLMQALATLDQVRQ